MVEAQATIRGAEAADFSTIADLINSSFEIERSYIYEPPETQNSVATAMESGTYFVAVGSHGDLIGCVYVNPRLRGIFRLAVAIAQRSQGYGRRLMAEAESYGKDARWPEVMIGILDFRQELLPYYRTLGYVEKELPRDLALQPPAHIIRPCQLIMMSKNLSVISLSPEGVGL